MGTLHACDVSNPAKPLPGYKRWAERVITEFFQQGEDEKEKDLPVSNFMDRESTNIAKCQLGFINVLVTPLFAAMNEFMPLDKCMQYLKMNKEFWDENVQAMEIEMLSGRQDFPSDQVAEDYFATNAAKLPAASTTRSVKA